MDPSRRVENYGEDHPSSIEGQPGSGNGASRFGCGGSRLEYLGLFRTDACEELDVGKELADWIGSDDGSVIDAIKSNRSITTVKLSLYDLCQSYLIRENEVDDDNNDLTMSERPDHRDGNSKYASACKRIASAICTLPSLKTVKYDCLAEEDFEGLACVLEEARDIRELSVRVADLRQSPPAAAAALLDAALSEHPRIERIQVTYDFQGRNPAEVASPFTHRSLGTLRRLRDVEYAVSAEEWHVVEMVNEGWYEAPVAPVLTNPLFDDADSTPAAAATTSGGGAPRRPGLRGIRRLRLEGFQLDRRTMNGIAATLRAGPNLREVHLVRSPTVAGTVDECGAFFDELANSGASLRRLSLTAPTNPTNRVQNFYFHLMVALSRMHDSNPTPLLEHLALYVRDDSPVAMNANWLGIFLDSQMRFPTTFVPALKFYGYHWNGQEGLLNHLSVYMEGTDVLTDFEIGIPRGVYPSTHVNEFITDETWTRLCQSMVACGSIRRITCVATRLSNDGVERGLRILNENGKSMDRFTFRHCCDSGLLVSCVSALHATATKQIHVFQDHDQDVLSLTIDEAREVLVHLREAQHLFDCPFNIKESSPVVQASGPGRDERERKNAEREAVLWQIDSIFRWNKHGRRNLWEGQSRTKETAVRLLSSVSDSLDSVYVHLRYYPELCCCNEMNPTVVQSDC